MIFFAYDCLMSGKQANNFNVDYVEITLSMYVVILPYRHLQLK